MKNKVGWLNRKKIARIFLYQGFRSLSLNALQLEKGSEEPKLFSKNGATIHHHGVCRLTFLLLPQQPGLFNSLSGLAPQCPETLQRYFKQDCGATGHLVSWFIQQYQDFQAHASLSSLCIQMLCNDTARNQAELNYPWCLKTFALHHVSMQKSVWAVVFSFPGIS